MRKILVLVVTFLIVFPRLNVFAQSADELLIKAIQERDVN